MLSVSPVETVRKLRFCAFPCVCFLGQIYSQAHFQRFPLFADVVLKYPANRDSGAAVTAAVEAGSTRAEALAMLAHAWEDESGAERDTPSAIDEEDADAAEDAGAQADLGKLNVWVIGRQQAAASDASFWIEGFVNRLLDREDPVSCALLERADFHVVQ